jgi:cytochrome c-type biogenesis protein
MIEEATLLAATGIAFASGLASFLSPCVLPLAPVYLASLAGPEILEAGTERRRLPLFFHSLSFVLGFTLIFSLWGAGAGLIGSALVEYSNVIRIIVGILLVLFGAVMLASLKVPWLNFEKSLSPSLGRKSGYLRSLLTGGLFCLAWTPCLSWQITGILSLAGGSGTALRGTWLLAVYSLGLGLPFLAMGLAFDHVSRILKNIGRYSRWIFIAGGLMLITVGTLILTNRLVLISSL